MTLFSMVVTTQSDPGAQQDNPRTSHFSGPQILSAPLSIQASHGLLNCESAGTRPRVHSLPLQAVSLLLLNLSWAYRMKAQTQAQPPLSAPSHHRGVQNSATKFFRLEEETLTPLPKHFPHLHPPEERMKMSPEPAGTRARGVLSQDLYLV